MKMELGKGKQ